MNNHDIVCDDLFLICTMIVISMLDHADFSITLYTKYSYQGDKSSKQTAFIVILWNGYLLYVFMKVFK